MTKKILFFIMCMIIILSSKSVKATTISSNTNIPTISNVYTEGIYRFDNTNEIDMVLMLNTDVSTRLIIFDDEMNIQLLSALPYRRKFYIHNFKANQVVGIIGEGEVAISFEKIK
ncbi:MAG: hypothetical protein E7A11_18650 [Clostridium sp.]|uniref:hypothetical protein n=1 Tax=Clostridium sp. TaxID=1506 RepID=UPI0028FFDCCA|nr:hypothetical protein [Clostridium sp.]MDU1127270.1 hypothetical protein [Clostridium sp.]MDU6875686.1 hypothetical protein [Clostridium sp.]MDU6936895.1 hypothetical protein [Clostridium sp.]